MKREITDKDKIRAKERYKELSTKEKISYIWEYYRLHFLAGALIVFFIGSMINNYIINPPKKTGLSVVSVNALYDEIKMDEFINEVNNTLIDNPDKYEMILENTIFDSVDGSYFITMMQKIAAMMAAQEIDMIIAPTEYFDLYVKNGAFLDLSTLPEFPVSKFEPHMAMSEEDASEKVYGIKIGECPKLNAVEMYTDNMILGIVINSPRIEKVVEFVNYIYETE